MLHISGCGEARFAGKVLPCTLGRGGTGAKQREGDGVTPAGQWSILGGLHIRPDRMERPRTALAVHPITPWCGWCDAPDDPNYNRYVVAPYGASHETLWRDDHAYDILIPLSFNTNPVRQGAGSAIFLHLLKPGNATTEGCVAFAIQDMAWLAQALRPDTPVRITP